MIFYKFFFTFILRNKTAWFSLELSPQTLAFDYMLQISVFV